MVCNIVNMNLDVNGLVGVIKKSTFDAGKLKAFRNNKNWSNCSSTPEQTILNYIVISITSNTFFFPRIQVGVTCIYLLLVC